MMIGVISDTHGLLREEAVTALAGMHHILHAGDVGDEGILDVLRGIAPLTAIRGNIDGYGPCSLLPETEVVAFGDVTFYMLHDGKQLDLNPSAAGFAAVISGHSHQPKIEWRKGVLFFNPGSAGPRRFQLPVTVGKIEVVGGKVEAAIVPLL
jgi:putative phosphoesterase